MNYDKKSFAYAICSIGEITLSHLKDIVNSHNKPLLCLLIELNQMVMIFYVFR
ncbi:hypothetical protein DSUL_40024 [Desulfovibrionales bacterium]